VVITNEVLRDELPASGIAENIVIEYTDQTAAIENADACIDLLFQPGKERIQQLQSLKSSIIIINSISSTLEGLPSNFVRINGWPGFLKRPIVEASCNSEEIKNIAEKVLSHFGKKTEWVPDVPGFVTARVVSMIINEAYFALDEKVSSKEEIDTAMKLGTNYPYGPFEWGEKIGLPQIHELLQNLARQNSRYEPAPLLKQEALQS